MSMKMVYQREKIENVCEIEDRDLEFSVFKEDIGDEFYKL